MDGRDRELSGGEEGFIRDDNVPLIFDFDGGATLRKDRRRTASKSQEVVQELNSELSDISNAIRDELKPKLPAGADIIVDIEFSRGSVDWAGIIAISDWMARIAENIAFVEYVIKAATFSVNKIIRSRIEQRVPIQDIHTNVNKRRQPDPIHPVSRFLWWASGAVVEILRDSKTDKAKFEGIGGAVLMTGVLAFLSGFYAVYTVFEGSASAAPLGIIFGLVWALAIFNLDRYIVSSMKKENPDAGNVIVRFLKELLPAVPRLLLAAVIGITISKPLELRLFQEPIYEQIQINRDATITEKEASSRSTYAQSIEGIDGELRQITSRIQAKEDRAKYLEDEFHKESDSTGGSRKYGYSIVARIKEKAARNARQETDQLRIETDPRRQQLQSRRDDIERDIQEQLTKFKEKLGTDFFTRMTALSDLMAKSASIWWDNYFIIFLIILVEIAPVLVKLLSPLGTYDVKVDSRNEIESQEAKYKKKAMKAIAKYHYQRIVDGEKHVEDEFFDMRNKLRTDRLRQTFDHWRAIKFDGQGPTFDELHKFIRDNVFTNRNP